MLRHRAGTAAAVLIAIVLGACGSGDDETSSAPAAAPTTATAAASRPVNAAYITVADTDYQRAQIAGIEKELEPGGGSVKVFNSNFDAQKALAQCKDAITSKRYDAILLYVSSPPTGVPCAAAAKAAGLPLIGIDTVIGTDPNDLEPQVPGVSGGVYFTPDGNAKGPVQLVTQACDGVDPCEVIIEIANPTDPVTTQVVTAVEDQVPNAEVVAQIATNYDPAQLAQKLPDVLAAHPGATVLQTTADSQALAAVPVVAKAGRTDALRILGSGGSAPGAAAVRDGKLFGSSGSWPEQEGRIAAAMAQKAVDGVPISPAGVDALTIDEPQILTKETIDAFTPEWGPGA